jgi:hypothetical protein
MEGAASGIIGILITKDSKNRDKEDWKDLGINTLKGASQTTCPPLLVPRTK